MEEQYLFEIDNDPKSLLAGYSQRGFMFLTPKQVCSICGKTWGMIRYAAYNYALDAYMVAGNLRFTINALEDYIDQVQDNFEKSYHDTMSRLEIYGAYALRSGIVTPAITSLRSHGHPITAVDYLMDITVPERYDKQPAGSTELDDYYDISLLGLPDRLAVWELAELMQLPMNIVSKDIGARVDDILEFTSVYDWLVSKQLVNANIGDKLYVSQSLDNMSGQLSLAF